MQIVENNQAVKVQLPAALAARVLGSVSRSELLGSICPISTVLMYWGFSEMSFLARTLDEEFPGLEFPHVPSPILRDYNWPSTFPTIMDHQRSTASFLSLRSRAFCFNEQGTAKTASAIWAADYLMHMGLVKRVLVICPMSVMYTAWQADIMQTAMHRTVAVAYGDRTKRSNIINAGHEFVIINFDGVRVVRDQIAANNFDLIIVDEANSYKEASTVRWRTLAKLVMPQTRLWMMTGTPASQSPEDAFGLARLVSPHRVPKFKTAWRDKTMVQLTKFKWIPRVNAKDLVFNALQPAIRYEKKDCLDLPEIVYQTRDIPLTVQASTYYKRLRTQLQIQAAGEQISAVNAAAAMSKLLQISGGAVYTDEHDVVEFDVTPRLNALKEIMDETYNKVIVFVPYLHTIDMITKFLTSHSISWDVIRGSVTANERAVIIRRFQTETDPRVLVIQPQSASHGVTLTAADTIVFWSPVMSVETYLQCVARIDRMGQKNSMTVIHLQGSDMERRVYKMLQGRVDSHQKLVELYREEIGV